MYPPNTNCFSFRLLITFILIVVFFNHFSYSQTITIDDNNYTTNQLVNVMVGNSCIPISNSNLSSNKSVAYFNNNNSNFSISEGIIIRNGIAKHTEGTYNNQNLSSQVNTNQDNQLQQLSNNNGQSATITDIAFLEFDFTPLANHLNFNFVFASNEYGEWQCGFSDIFAIFLTNKETGETINMAVIPYTNTNVSVKNIRDDQYNNSCFSVNENLFDTYNVNNPSNSSLNMRGYTQKINANAFVTPFTSYNIRFVIGDYNDSNYDSAVLIEADSFNSTIDLGENITTCIGSDVTIDTSLGDIEGFSYEWQRNGNTIANENESSLTTSQLGVYKVIVTNTNLNCTLTDEIIISELEVNPPNNLFQCDTSSSFDLTQNNYSTLNVNPDYYQIFYYNSFDNLTNNIPIESNLLTNYTPSQEQTIYLKIINTVTQQFCETTFSFDLNFINIDVNTPQDAQVCASDVRVNLKDLYESELLDGQNPNDYGVSYFTSVENATNNTNAISNPNSYLLPSNSDNVTISARVINLDYNSCFTIVTFNLYINPRPPVDSFQDVFECTSFTLEPLTNGNYYTGANGSGNLLNEGDVITESTRIFIFNEDENGCTNQSFFNIQFAEEFKLAPNYCGHFTVPSYPNATFYTEPDGPNGTGELIPTQTVLTSSQTIYFYATTSEGDFCIDKELQVNIIPLPPVDTLEDVVVCNSYTLPELVNGNYYTQPNGNGVQLSSGNVLTSSRTIYVYNKENNCSNSSSFTVAIINTDVFKNIDACGSYTLPNLAYGDYFTQANGNGEIIPQGSTISTSQTVYYYAEEVSTTPNCTENISFTIHINPTPSISVVEDIIGCKNNLPTLPNIDFGNYYTQPNGQGNQLFTGDTISSSQTIFVFNTDGTCSSQSSFNVELRDIPEVDNFTDIFRCEPYTLPNLTNGSYYTESNGQGEQLNAGDVIETSQIIYIYNEYSDLNTCNNQSIFEVHILSVEVDEIENVIACEEFTLPTLSVGDYYTQSGGNGEMLNAGDIITSNQTLYIYAENGDRFFCYDEHSFTIKVFNKPNIDFIENIEGCGSITLPNLNTSLMTVQYYTGANQNGLISFSDYTFTTPGTKAIYVRAFPPENPNCFTEKIIITTVYPLLELKINGGVICVDYDTGETTNPILLDANLDENEFEVHWFLEENLVGKGSSYNATEAGTYRVETIKLTPDVGNNCNYIPTEVLVEASSPKFEINFITDDFSDRYSIEVLEVNAGLGNYVFSINGIDFQSSPYFYNITPGEYTITIKDTSLICGSTSLNFVALKYPKFFTPNADGINDSWNIKDLKNDENAIIKIFDRNGKQIAVIKPSGPGWDGLNLNGNKMLSTDYWFVVEYYVNGSHKQFRSNFSLLRRKNL